MHKYFRSPIIIFFGVLFIACGVFYFEFVYKNKQVSVRTTSIKLLDFASDEINAFEVESFDTKNSPIKRPLRYALQKGLDGWQLVEPVQDGADQTYVVDLLAKIESESATMVNVKDKDRTAQMKEFGLDRPAGKWIFKLSNGETQEVLVSSISNFEGFPFIMKSHLAQVYVGQSIWYSQIAEGSTAYRDKRLYRNKIEELSQIRIKSLSDEFELLKQKEGWVIVGKNEIELDQDKILKFLNELAATRVLEYISDGDPSMASIKEKGLDKNFVLIELISSHGFWTARINLNAADNALYALTDRPTTMVKLDPLKWELFGNLRMIYFRNRTKAFDFDKEKIKKIAIKTSFGEVELVKKSDWSVFKNTDTRYAAYQSEGKMNSLKVDQFLQRVLKTEIADFNDKAINYPGKTDDLITFSAADGSVLKTILWSSKRKLKIDGLEEDVAIVKTESRKNKFVVKWKSIEDLSRLNFLEKDKEQ